MGCGSFFSKKPRPEYFRYRPRLLNAAARCIRGLGVKNLAQGSDSPVVQVGRESGEAASCTRLVSWMHAEPRIDERPDQPSPYRPLVVGRVARPQVPVVLRLVITMPGRQRAEPHRREQTMTDDIEDGPPTLGLEHRVIE